MQHQHRAPGSAKVSGALLQSREQLNRASGPPLWHHKLNGKIRKKLSNFHLYKYETYVSVCFYTHMHMWVSIITSFLKIVFKTHTDLSKLHKECRSWRRPQVGGCKANPNETWWDRRHLHLWTVLKHRLYSGIQNTFSKISSLQKFKTRLGFNIQPPLKLLHKISISSWKKNSNQFKKKKKNKWRPQSCTWIHSSRIQHGIEILSAVTYFSPWVSYSPVLTQYISDLVRTARRALVLQF